MKNYIRYYIVHTVKSRAVDRSTIQFLSIFGVLLTEMCYYYQGLLYRRATIQFLNFLGGLLTKSCYKQRRAPAPDFTVDQNFWFTKVTRDTYIKVGIKFIQDLFRFEIIPAVFSIHLLYQVLFSFEKRFKAPNIIQTLFKRWQHGSKRNS